MGASTWSYFTPYQTDVGKAFSELRQQIFREGRYQDGDMPFDTAAADAVEQRVASMLPSLTSQQRRAWEMTQAVFAAARRRMKQPAQPQASSIEELLQRRGEAGTHSILDMDRIAATPADAAVSPLSPRRLRELLGTERPTRAIIESAFAEWPEFRRRWQGVYIVVYANNEPSEICFAGTSGD